MYIDQHYICECGAPLTQNRVQNHPSLRALKCTSRSCNLIGMVRYVRLPVVPADQIVNPRDIDCA